MTERKSSKKEKEIQKKYLTLQILKQQFSAFVEERRAISEKLAELNMTIRALEKLETVKQKEEIWSTLGSGTFIKSDIKDTENVIIAIGAGIVVKEKREKAIQILQKRMDELQKIDREMTEEMSKFSHQIETLERQIEHAVQNE